MFLVAAAAHRRIDRQRRCLSSFLFLIKWNLFALLSHSKIYFLAACRLSYFEMVREKYKVLQAVNQLSNTVKKIMFGIEFEIQI